MPGKSFDRAVRLGHIRMSFVHRYQNRKPDEVTSSQVARALMLEPSGHVRSLLGELVMSGFLIARKVDNPHAKNLKGDNAFKVWYKLSDREVKRIEEDARKIKIKVNGQIVGQMRLF